LKPASRRFNIWIGKKAGAGLFVDIDCARKASNRDALMLLPLYELLTAAPVRWRVPAARPQADQANIRSQEMTVTLQDHRQRA
jgi:hypothetical protein